MSLAIKTSVVDHATPAIQAKLAKCEPSRLRAIVAPALNRQVQTHLVGNGRNKRGWPSTGFWARAARATSWQPLDTGGQSSHGFVISINQIGVRQRYYGGPIRPVRAKALAIPISPVSYGHVPADFPGLFLLPTKKGAYLVQRVGEISTGKESKTNFGKRVAGMGGNSRRRLRGELNFLFKLSGGVNQAGDESIVPSADALMEHAMTRIEEAVK